MAVISMDEVPIRNSRPPGLRFGQSCQHRRLVLDAALGTVECRHCGKQWKDYLGEAERGAGRSRAKRERRARA